MRGENLLVLFVLVCAFTSAELTRPECKRTATIRSSLQYTKTIIKNISDAGTYKAARLPYTNGCWAEEQQQRKNATRVPRNFSAINSTLATTCDRSPFKLLQVAKQITSFLVPPVEHLKYNSTNTTQTADSNATSPLPPTVSVKSKWTSRRTKWSQLELAENNDTTGEDARSFLLKHPNALSSSDNNTTDDNAELGLKLKNALIGQSSAADRARARQDITEHSAAMVAIREEMCLRRIRTDISSAVTAQVFAQTMEKTFAQTKGFMDEIFDAIGAPLLETLGYILGLFLLSLMGRNFLNKIVKAIGQLLPGALDLIVVPIISDMTIQTVTSGVVYAVCDGSVPAIIAAMRVGIMASITAYMAMTIGPQLQHRISHQASQAIIRDTSTKVVHHVVEGVTHSVTHVVLHKVIHQFMCIYCYYHGQYCERCFYYGEALPLLQQSVTTPTSFGPLGTSEDGLIADVYNLATHAFPTNVAKAAVANLNSLEVKARGELDQYMMTHPKPEYKQNATDSGGGALRGTD